LTFHDSNPLTQARWIIDCRIHDLDGCETKRDQVHNLQTNLVHCCRLPFIGVLMNPWHAARDCVVSHVLRDESLVLQRASQRL
jgi:hypothetical protein